MKLLLVKWLDAEASACEGGWKQKEDIEKWMEDPIKPVTSVGFLLHETDKFLVLAAHIGGDEIDGEIKIPKGWIISKILLDEKLQSTQST